MSYPVGWKPYLFVGGPWNGQVHLIRDDQHEWYVRQPTYRANPPHPFSYEDRDPTGNLTPDYRVWVYVKRAYWTQCGLERRVAWVFTVDNDQTDVMAAAFTALGIPMVRMTDDDVGS